jgi:N-methylhydantoinase A
VGQEYTVTVPVPVTLSDEWLPSVRAEFDRRHERTYGHASVEEPVEVVSLRLTAFGRMPELKPQSLPNGGPNPPAEAKRGSRPVFFSRNAGRAGGIDEHDHNFVDCPVYDRDALLAGNVIVGPALVLETGATTVLSPGLQLTVTPFGSLQITRKEEIA